MLKLNVNTEYGIEAEIWRVNSIRYDIYQENVFVELQLFAKWNAKPLFTKVFEFDKEMFTSAIQGKRMNVGAEIYISDNVDEFFDCYIDDHTYSK